ncbi:MAG: DUF1566 domain-containing protein, partial [Desulfuromonadales bacterium]|nr:DUF1566 domain-containing protein [Desulfuromonadales bacterium]
LSAQEIAQMMTSKGYHSASAKGTFTHQYQVKTSGDVQVVLDQATGLMWQQSASADLIRGPAVQEYIQQINAQKHAGFADWRLPTIEELAALLPAEMNSEGVYIDAEFSGVLWNCLSASPVKGEADKFWGLDVNAGAVSDFYLDDDFSILLVRTP